MQRLEPRLQTILSQHAVGSSRELLTFLVLPVSIALIVLYNSELSVSLSLVYLHPMSSAIYNDNPNLPPKQACFIHRAGLYNFPSRLLLSFLGTLASQYMPSAAAMLNRMNTNINPKSRQACL